MVKWPAQGRGWKGESHGGNENSMTKDSKAFVGMSSSVCGAASDLYHIGAREARSCHLL